MAVGDERVVGDPVGAGSAGWVHATVPRRRDTRLLGLTDRPILAWLGG
jgi:hypothetical protein